MRSNITKITATVYNTTMETGDPHTITQNMNQIGNVINNPNAGQLGNKCKPGAIAHIDIQKTLEDTNMESTLNGLHKKQHSYD